MKFLEIADKIGECSSYKMKHGALAHSGDFIINAGYNMVPAKCTDTNDQRRIGGAVENMIAFASRSAICGSTIYVTHLLTHVEARMLINAGVKKIVARNAEQNKESFNLAIAMLMEAGIDLEIEE